MQNYYLEHKVDQSSIVWSMLCLMSYLVKEGEASRYIKAYQQRFFNQQGFQNQVSYDHWLNRLDAMLGDQKYISEVKSLDGLVKNRSFFLDNNSINQYQRWPEGYELMGCINVSDEYDQVLRFSNGLENCSNKFEGHFELKNTVFILLLMSVETIKEVSCQRYQSVCCPDMQFKIDWSPRDRSSSLSFPSPRSGSVGDSTSDSASFGDNKEDCNGPMRALNL